METESGDDDNDDDYHPVAIRLFITNKAPNQIDINEQNNHHNNHISSISDQNEEQNLMTANIQNHKSSTSNGRKIKHIEYLQSLEKEAVSRGDHRFGKQRKPTEKNIDMLNIRQQSNAAVELTFSAARDGRCNVPSTYKAALQTENVGKWIEAYESEMASLVEHGTFSAPRDKISYGKNAVITRFVFDLKRGEDIEVLKYKAQLVD